MSRQPQKKRILVLPKIGSCATAATRSPPFVTRVANHTHLAPTVMYVLSGSHFIRRDEHGATMVDTRTNPEFVLPKVLFAASTPRHTLENTGVDDLIVNIRKNKIGDRLTVAYLRGGKALTAQVTLQSDTGAK